MDRPAEFGSWVVIKGQLTAQEDIVLSGRVEGSITVIGHTVTVKSGAELIADIHARVVVVSGQVVGTVRADERIELLPTADVEGELSAPVFRMDDGAVFKGKAETTKVATKPGLQLAS